MEQKLLIENILKLFSQEKVTYRLNEIAKELSINSDSPEYIAMKGVLKELCNQKILIKSSRRRYSLNDYEHVTTFEGKLIIRNGAGVVLTDSPNARKISIKQRYLKTAFDGDRVLVRLLKSNKRGRKRGEVVGILDRESAAIKGKIEYFDEFYYFIPYEEKYYIDFLISQDKLNGAKDGDIVKVKLLYWDDPLKHPQAEVVKRISSASDKNEIQNELDIFIDEYSLPVSFPKKVDKEAESIPNMNVNQLIKDRVDLRKEMIITIDPDDAKDFDDALSLKMLDNGNQLLGVHIADVSYYVKDNSKLDKEAFLRGNSTYLVDRVIPMLPERLSNDLCSLKQGRIRPAFSVFMELTPSGAIKDYKIVESVIKSQKRFTYGQVQEIIDKGKGPLSVMILSLHKLTRTLRKKRFKIGGINFESIEVKFVLDENKFPIAAERRKSNQATQLVEECMLIANKTIAEHIDKISKKYGVKPNLPFLYRVHDEPKPDKLSEILQFVKTFNVRFKLKNNSSREINNLIKAFEERPEKQLIHQIMLRAMSKAEYSGKNIGHYGLGYRHYAHFTSPIRRYPDLVVHRLIKEYAKGKINRKRIIELNALMVTLGQHCLETERASVEAERASIRLIQTFMARKYLGKTLDGTISGVTNFGIFVMIDDFYAEGLLHIKDLKDDYYIFDEKNYRLIGRRNKRLLKLGGRIKIKIIHVDIDHRKIQLEFIENLE